MRNLILLLSLLLLNACATVHSGNYAQPVGENNASKSSDDGSDKKPTKSGLVISGIEDTDLSSQYFTAINLTFENTTSDWVRVKSIKLDFGDPILNKDIQFPVGQDLAQWAESIQQREAIRDYNSQLIIGAITAAAAGVAAGSSNASLRTAGALGTVAGASALTVSSLSKTAHGLSVAALVPESHLLSGTISIPPGLFVKKWITLYAKRPDNIPYASRVILTLVHEDNTEDTVSLKFRRDTITASDWQRENPYVKAVVKEDASLANHL